MGSHYDDIDLGLNADHIGESAASIAKDGLRGMYKRIEALIEPNDEVSPKVIAKALGMSVLGCAHRALEQPTSRPEYGQFQEFLETPRDDSDRAPSIRDSFEKLFGVSVGAKGRYIVELGRRAAAQCRAVIGGRRPRKTGRARRTQRIRKRYRKTRR